MVLLDASRAGHGSAAVTQGPHDIAVYALLLPSLTENLGSSKKTEHFRRWQLIMRYMVTHGYTYVHLCKTADMLADPMAGTPKDYIQFLNFRRYVTGMS